MLSEGVCPSRNTPTQPGAPTLLKGVSAEKPPSTNDSGTPWLRPKSSQCSAAPESADRQVRFAKIFNQNSSVRSVSSVVKSSRDPHPRYPRRRHLRAQSPPPRPQE